MTNTLLVVPKDLDFAVKVVPVSLLPNKFACNPVHMASIIAVAFQ